MGDEGLGIGAARNRVEHRRFHFHEPVLVHEVADGAHDLAAHFKALAAVLIHDEVDVALAAAGFYVLKALVLFRERANALSDQTELLHANGKLAAARAKQRALGGNDVAEIERFECLERLFTAVRGREEILHFPGEVAHGGKCRLAHHALEHHAAGNGNLHVGGFDFLSGFFTPTRAQIPEQVGTAEVIGEGNAVLAQFGKFCAALLDDVVFVFRNCLLRLVLEFFSHFCFLTKEGDGDCAFRFPS